MKYDFKVGDYVLVDNKEKTEFTIRGFIQIGEHRFAQGFYGPVLLRSLSLKEEIKE